MPVCLNCGRAVEPGTRYCGECGGVEREARVADLVRLAAEGLTSPAPRRSDRRWLVLSMLVLCALLVAGAYVLISAIPPGPGGGAGIQAAACRKKMENLLEAVEAYRIKTGREPAAGVVDGDNPLVTGGHVGEPPGCPATGRPYSVVYVDGQPQISCDSGLEGHELAR